MRSKSLAVPALLSCLLLSYCSVIETMRSQKRMAIEPEVEFASIGPVSTSTSAGDPPVEKKFKNIQVLHGLPSSQLYPVMALMSNSLGVTCSHCHTQFFEEESRSEKQIARQMIRMTRGINRTQFQGEPTVTCYTCHNGKNYPASVPQIAQAGWRRMLAPATPQAALPDIDAILALYQSAQPVSALRPGAGGEVSMVGGLDERLAGRFDITWIPAVQIRSDIRLPPPVTPILERYGTGNLDLRKLYDQMSVVASETVDGAPAVIVSAESGDEVPERLAFDASSGRLLRVHRSIPTDLGHLPEEIWFEDYRQTGGVLMPRVIRVARGDFLVTFRFSEFR